MATPNEMAGRNATGEGTSPAERLRRQVKAQPAKAVATGLLVCVLLVLLLRGALRPGTASAGNATQLLVPTAAQAVETPAVLLQPEAILQTVLPPMTPIVVPAATRWPLPRDIFAMDLRQFPKADARTATGPVDGPVRELPEDATARLVEIKRQAGLLQLEGTLRGPASAAFFGGTCVGLGQEHRGFRLVEVGERWVQVEREGVRLEVRMVE
jgi:hypothetical protein